MGDGSLFREGELLAEQELLRLGAMQPRQVAAEPVQEPEGVEQRRMRGRVEGGTRQLFLEVCNRLRRIAAQVRAGGKTDLGETHQMATVRMEQVQGNPGFGFQFLLAAGPE